MEQNIPLFTYSTDTIPDEAVGDQTSLAAYFKVLLYRHLFNLKNSPSVQYFFCNPFEFTKTYVGVQMDLMRQGAQTANCGEYFSADLNSVFYLDIAQVVKAQLKSALKQENRTANQDQRSPMIISFPRKKDTVIHERVIKSQYRSSRQ